MFVLQTPSKNGVDAIFIRALPRGNKPQVSFSFQFSLRSLIGLFYWIIKSDISGRQAKTMRNVAWYSEHLFDILDLTSHLPEGSTITDIYAKSKNSQLYLPFSSSHLAHCKRAIPYGVTLLVRRNCSTDEFLNKRCVEYKWYLKFQGYIMQF